MENQEPENKPIVVGVVKTANSNTAISSALTLLNWTELKTLSNEAGSKLNKLF